MVKEHPVSVIHPKLHIRFKLTDGRCSTLVVWPDGEWKVEIFASLEHAQQFAINNDMEVIDHDDDSGS